MKNYRYISDIVTLELDQQTCVGCGLCVNVCPHNVFVMNSGRAAIFDRDVCMECGACSLNCPVKAIKVDSGVGCASGMINQWLSDLKIITKNDTGCC